MGHMVGIDLGTTNSVIAFTELGRQRCVKVEENEFTSAVLPSCVGVGREGEWVVGSRAKRERQQVREFKRHIGTDRSYQLGDKVLRPHELSAMVLRKLREGFEQRHGPIDGAVITVPALFNEAQRRETMEAGRLAGLHVLRVINEPSAAAIAYTLDARESDDETLVVDWGGGTLDVSIVIGDGDILDVQCNDGDMHLGGKDIDALILRRLLARCAEEGTDLTNDAVATHELLRIAEQVKLHLAERNVWDEPIALRSHRLFVEFELTRAELDELIAPLIGRVFAAIERTLEKNVSGALRPEDISDVILVGGSSQLPLFRQRVREYFGREGRLSLNPMEVVALGAAYQAQHARSSLEAGLITVHSLTMNLGVSALGVDRKGVTRQDMFTCLLPAGTKIPARATETFLTIHDNQRSVDVKVYELPRKPESVAGATPWEVRTIGDLPIAPAGSYPILVTFAYGVDQTLTVTVEIPDHGITQTWVPTRQQELEDERERSQAAVDDAFDADAALGAAPSERLLEQLRGFAASVGVALREHDGAARSLAALTTLEDALASRDLDRANAARSRLLTALAQDGVALSD